MQHIRVVGRGATMYRLTIRKHAIKTLRRMRPRDTSRVRDELDKLAQNPGSRDIDVKPLRGRPGFRIRVGPWRVIFEQNEETRIIDVLRIGPRGDIYKD